MYPMFDVIRHIFTIPLQNQRNSKGGNSNESFTHTAYRLTTSSTGSGCRRGMPISIGNIHSSPNISLYGLKPVDSWILDR